MFEIRVLTIIGLAGFSVVWFALKIGISPMPSSAKAKRAILTASEAAAEGIIIELGSGWGTLIFALARKYPHRRVIGYEISWLPWLYTYLYKSIFRLHHVEIYRQKFLTADLSSASLLVCYLFPEGMIHLQQKMADEHVANSYLISSTFALPPYRPVETTRLNDIYNTPIYIYQLG